MWYNKYPFTFQTMSAEIFAEKALFLQDTTEKSQDILVLPDVKLTCFTLQNLSYVSKPTTT